MSALHLLWWLLASFGVTYVVVGSELPLAPELRLYLGFRFPRSLGKLVSCAMCSGFWGAAVVTGIPVQLGVLEQPWGQCLYLGLAATGLLWVISAFNGALRDIAAALDRVGQAVQVQQRRPFGKDVTEEPDE